MADMRLIVAGAGGRMGRTLMKAIAETPGLVLAGATEGEGSPLRRPGLRRARRAAAEPRGGDERSAPAHPGGRRDPRFHRSGRDREARGARRRDACSRTSSAPPARSAADDAKIAEAAKKTAIMKSGNMSLGVNLLAVMTRHVAAALDEDFDIEIVEMHHNKKIDAPSGTALLLGEAAAEGRKIDLKKQSRARPRRPHRRAQGRHHRLCVAARRQCRGRAQRDLRRRRRAHRADPQGDRPHDLRTRRAESGAVGRGKRAGALHMLDVLGLKRLDPDKWALVLGYARCRQTKSLLTLRAATRPSSRRASAIPSAPARSARYRRDAPRRATPCSPPTSTTGTGLVVCAVCGPPVTGSRIISQLP